MSWSIAFVSEEPPHTTWSFTPLGAGASYDLQGTIDTDPGRSLSITAEGQITYNGPGCNAQLTLLLASSIGNPAELVVVIYVLQDGNLVFGPQLLDGSDNGSHIFPFTLVDTLGAGQLVQVAVGFSANNNSGAMSVQMSGTASNV